MALQSSFAKNIRLYPGLHYAFFCLLLALTSCAQSEQSGLPIEIELADGVTVENVIIFVRTGPDDDFATGVVVKSAQELGLRAGVRSTTIELATTTTTSEETLVAIVTCSGQATCACVGSECSPNESVLGPDCQCTGQRGFGAGRTVGTSRTLKLLVKTSPEGCDLDGDLIPDCGRVGCCGHLSDGLQQAVSDCCDVSEGPCEGRSAHPFRAREVPAAGASTEVLRRRHGLQCGDGTDNDCRGGDVVCGDLDGDGFSAPLDCDESNPNINPNAVENCIDEIDENCDGAIFCDGDGDGVLSDLDCDDNDPQRFPGNAEICGDGIDQDCDPMQSDQPCVREMDADGDGFICPIAHIWLVGEISGCTGGQYDCNDLDAGVYPGAPEICGDDIDQDCDGNIPDCDPDDGDQDGYRDAARGGLDCDDTRSDVHPGSPDRCGDGVDQDCDGRDLDCAMVEDRDFDRWPMGVDCSDNDANIFPGADELCNGRDDDCDGRVDEGNPQKESLNDSGVRGPCGAECREGQACTCRVGPWVCTSRQVDGIGNDTSGVAVRCFGRGPDQAGIELCNGLDDDCNGTIDEGSEACYEGDVSELSAQAGLCIEGSTRCTVTPLNRVIDCIDAGDCPAGQACVMNTCATPDEPRCFEQILPTVEVCNGQNEDCDARIDEDHQTEVCGTNQGQCETGMSACEGGRVVCMGNREPQAERCDDLDHDCDGNPRNGFNDFGRSCQVGRGSCRRSGRNVCTNNGNGTRCNAQAGRPQNEACDGDDNDCDGRTDEDTGGGACGSDEGECSRGREVCRNGRIQCQGGQNAVGERCNNRDDDCDGDTDEDFGNLGDECNTGQGICAAEGVFVCGNNGNGVVCSAQANVQPRAETCNAVDDDCDGQIDEGNGAALCDGARADRCISGRCRCGERNPCDGQQSCVDGACQ